ncbi:hypothetical protein IQ244_11885 [Nostoc sp. LEGE 06077]|nr:hypothetical protein [Nostoc sp. LEGE 06077]
MYESQVRRKVEAGNHDKIVVIDIETGDFEVDTSEIAACDRLEARHPDGHLLYRLKYYNISLLINN